MPFWNQVTGVGKQARVLFPEPVGVWRELCEGAEAGRGEVKADLAVLDGVCGRLQEPRRGLAVPLARGREGEVLQRLGGRLQADRRLDLVEGGHGRVAVLPLAPVNQVRGQQAFKC